MSCDKCKNVTAASTPDGCCCCLCHTTSSVAPSDQQLKPHRIPLPVWEPLELVLHADGSVKWEVSP